MTTDDLNVRAGPGTGFDVLRQLELGASVVLLGRVDVWVELESGGWVFYSSEWIDLDHDIDLLQVRPFEPEEQQ